MWYYFSALFFLLLLLCYLAYIGSALLGVAAFLIRFYHFASFQWEETMLTFFLCCRCCVSLSQAQSTFAFARRVWLACSVIFLDFHESMYYNAKPPMFATGWLVLPSLETINLNLDSIYSTEGDTSLLLVCCLRQHFDLFL